MIVAKSVDLFDNEDLSAITTTGKDSSVIRLGEKHKAYGAEIIGSDRSLQMGGIKLLFKGSHGITGSGKISFEIYTGEPADSGADTATELVDTLGPYGADELGTVKQWDLQGYDLKGTLKVKAKASMESAFSAGSFYLTLTTTL